MKRLTMLITPEGEWVLPGSSELLRHLGDPQPDYDAQAFAVNNLGFIKFSVIERAIVEIELHPRNVALPALLAAQQQIQSAGVGLFRIKYFEETWQSEITSSAEQAMTRLSHLTAPAFVPQSRDRFIVEPQGFAQLLKDEDNPLRLMAQKWRTSFGRFDATLIPFAIDHGFMPHMIIMGVRPHNPDPVFRFIGDAHANWLGARYRFSAIGEKMESFPDKDYGLWASQHYKGVAATGEPRYDHVSATVHHAPTPYYTRYERLMLPWTSASDEILVTMFSKRLGEYSTLQKCIGSESAPFINPAKSA